MPAHPDLFADIDAMDPDAFARHLADGVSFRFGNADPVVGRAAVRDVWASFCDTVDGVSHTIVEQFESGDAVIVESSVTYTKPGGATVTVPVVTIYRGAGELIDDYRVFIDLAPLFAEG